MKRFYKSTRARMRAAGVHKRIIRKILRRRRKGLRQFRRNKW